MTDTPRTCALCGAAANPLFEAADPGRPRGDRYPLYRCAGCGVAFTPPVPAAYPAVFFGVDRLKRRTPFLSWRAARIASIVPRGRVLDYGCGAGTFVRALAARGRHEVFGFDPNLAADGERLFRSWTEAAAAGPYDLITFWHSLEHLENPRAVIETCGRSLSPGGRLFVCVPDFGSRQARQGSAWFHLDLPRHLWHFDRSSLDRLLRESGFTPERWFARAWEYDPAGWLGTWWNRLFSRPNAFYFYWKGEKTRDASFWGSLSTLPLLGPAALLRALLPGGGATLTVVARKG